VPQCREKENRMELKPHIRLVRAKPRVLDQDRNSTEKSQIVTFEGSCATARCFGSWRSAEGLGTGGLLLISHNSLERKKIMHLTSKPPLS